jgi:hypothetical protein
MARVRFLGSEPVTVPELGPERVVQPDEVVEVPDARFEGYVCQPMNWEGVEEPKTSTKKTTTAAPKSAPQKGD